jgi:hypothetical protein
MKNTRYVKVNVSFVLCYDEPMDTVPAEMANIEDFINAGVESAFVAKNLPNRQGVYICPYAKLSASLIHAPRGLPQVLVQTLEGAQTFLTRKQQAERTAREEARRQAEEDSKAKLMSTEERRQAKRPVPAKKGKRQRVAAAMDRQVTKNTDLLARLAKPRRKP